MLIQKHYKREYNVDQKLLVMWLYFYFFNDQVNFFRTIYRQFSHTTARGIKM